MRLSRVQLNTVVRPPLEKFARAVNKERLREIAETLSAVPGVPRVDIIVHGMSVFASGREVEADYPQFGRNGDEKLINEIVQMLKRRPCTALDIDRTFTIGGPDKVEQLLEPQVLSGTIEKRIHGDKVFYQCHGAHSEKL